LPKFTAEEQWVQKKQGEFIQGDVRMLSGIDVEKPFQNVQDAVQRLLPFHVSGLQLCGWVAAVACSAAGTLHQSSTWGSTVMQERSVTLPHQMGIRLNVPAPPSATAARPA
jgi:hypothetical protein